MEELKALAVLYGLRDYLVLGKQQQPYNCLRSFARQAHVQSCSMATN